MLNITKRRKRPNGQ